MRRPATRPVFFATIVAIAGLLMLAFQLAGPPSAQGRAAGTGTLSVARALHAAGTVTPVLNCAQLQAMDLTQLPGAPTEITSAATVTINGASYCEVKGEQPPQLQFDLRLPVST